nr:structural protein [Tolivirales sp.]
MGNCYSDRCRNRVHLTTSSRNNKNSVSLRRFQATIYSDRRIDYYQGYHLTMKMKIAPKNTNTNISTRNNGKREINGPTSIAKRMSGSRPVIIAGLDHCIVHHRELVATVRNSAAYTPNNGLGIRYRVNPLEPSMFTWLPSQAANYDMYTVNKLSYEYVPMCSSLTAGRVALFHDKDSQDVLPLDRQSLANVYSLSNSNAWAPMSLTVKTDSVKRFISDNDTADPKLIDFGQFGFATYGGGDTNEIGDIYVNYSITLFEPQPTASLVETMLFSSATQTFTNLGLRYATASSAATQVIYTFRTPGTFLLSCTVRCTTFVGSDTNSTASVVNSATAVTNAGTAVSATVNITVSAPGQQFRMLGTGFLGSVTHIVRSEIGNTANVPG